MNCSIGLEKGIVRLVPHQPEWKEMFEQEKTRILAAIDKAVEDRYIVFDHEIIVDCQHIGSTAIPGIVTKPIIDIGMAVTRFEEGYALVKPLEQLGYVYHGENGVPHRHYFDYGDPCTMHLHVFGQDSEEWQNHILFRDFLIRHPELAKQYEQLKMELAEMFRTNRENYTDGKAEFIQKMIAQARAEQEAAKQG